MNPDKTAEIIQQAAQNSNDPIFAGLAWVLGVIVLLIAIAKPIMGMVRQYQSNRAESAKDGADEALYKQLKEQIEINSRDIRNLIDERNRWHEEAINLRSRVTQLEEAKLTIERMKQKLDEKDELLRERDAENRRLMYEIIQLKDRLHLLELRLADDEAKFCATCDLKKPA